MAVKVMVAPAIASGQLAKPAAARPPPSKENAAVPRAKRRRSAVYDADGNEVFITLICLKCQKIRPLSQFGLRKMADGSIRNQPWCRTCRSAPSSRAEAEARGDTGEATAGESPISAESPASSPSLSPDPAATPSKKARPGAVAAEVAAALWAGRR